MNRISSPYVLATTVYVAFLVLIVVLADTGTARWVFTASTLFPLGDKICHMIIMGLFSYLLNSALCCRTLSVRHVRVLVGSLVVCGLVLAEEVSQHWLVLRNADGWDLAFDFLGIYIFGLLAIANLRMKAKGRRSKSDIVTHT